MHKVEFRVQDRAELKCMQNPAFQTGQGYRHLPDGQSAPERLFAPTILQGDSSEFGFASRHELRRSAHRLQSVEYRTPKDHGSLTIRDPAPDHLLQCQRPIRPTPYRWNEPRNKKQAHEGLDSNG